METLRLALVLSLGLLVPVAQGCASREAEEEVRPQPARPGPTPPVHPARAARSAAAPAPRATQASAPPAEPAPETPTIRMRAQAPQPEPDPGQTLGAVAARKESAPEEPRPRARRYPFPRGPCGEIHPFPFARFGSQLRHHCRGAIHVSTPLSGPEAAEVVFAVYERLLADLGQSPLAALAEQPRPLFVYLFPTASECAAYLNRSRPEGGAIAAYHPSLSRVLIGFKGYEAYTSELPEVLRHELVHHLHDGRSRNSPLWLSEGLAEAYGESHPHALEARPLALDLVELLTWGQGQHLSVARAVDRYFQATVLVRALVRDPRTRETFVRYVLDPWPIHDLDELGALLGLEVSELYEVFVQEYAASQDARVERERGRAAAKEAARAEAAAEVVVPGAPSTEPPAEHPPEAGAQGGFTSGAFAFGLLVLCGLGGLGLVLSRRGPRGRAPALPVA